MARDKIAVDLLLQTKQADREIAKINRKFKNLEKSASKIKFGGTGGGDKVRALGTGLSKATVKADEFNKSLEASNARVIAFGASAGIIMQVDRALKAMVTSAMKVEKAMADVNIVMNVNARTLEQFGRGMFKVAKETAQSFDTVAEAATELARQGLGTEKSLKRTSDALILTRLTGMSAVDAVKSLTAAVNSFNKEGVTSAQVINKMAKVDQAFAVSSDDLAKAISRVGSSAVAAGVNMDQLLAITTAVQQKTARGGAVIGNAFKTIFTRIQRTDVQAKLQAIGVATRDMQGAMLSGTKVLENLAGQFGNLSKAQQANIAENVAGVFQVNILRAALGDLSSKYSVYGRALKDSSSATDEAYRKNEELNKTLDALANRTLVNLTQAGAALGGATLEPAIRKLLNSVNTAIDAFGEGGKFEAFGKGLGKNIVEGIGSFISGPGIMLMGAAATKLFINLAGYASKAFADIMGINKATKQRAALEEAVVATIASEPALLKQVRSGTLNVLQVEKDILATITASNVERARLQAYAKPLARSIYKRGARTGPSGATGGGALGFTGLPGGGGSLPGGAGGFVPNFANAGGERMAAAAGGYRAGSIRTMAQPGVGTMMYNSAETVKRFPGMSQSAIMPPQGSPAGAGYGAAFSAAHGFDPYAGAGFVPSFAKIKSKAYGVNVPMNNYAKRDIGIIMGQGSKSTPLSYGNSLQSIPKLRDAIYASSGFAGLLTGAPIKSAGSPNAAKGGRKLNVKTTKFTATGIPAVTMFPMTQAEADRHAAGQDTQTLKVLSGALERYKNEVAFKLWNTQPKKGSTQKFNLQRLNQGTAGDIFEEAVRSSMPQTGAPGEKFVRTEAFDFDGKRYAHPALVNYMNREGAAINKKSKVEAKIGAEAAKSGNIPKKIVNDLLAKGETVGPYASKMALFKQLTGLLYGGSAMGFVPNFSPVSSAIGREMQAGIPASAIRVGSSPALRSAGNPGGVGVYNTINEPGGLKQGISRSRGMGIDPKGHGAANGFVPNFLSFARSKWSPGSGPPGGKGSPTKKDSKDNTDALNDLTAAVKDNSGKIMAGAMALTYLGSGSGDSKFGATAQATTSALMMGGMGAMVAGPHGAIAGGALGLHQQMEKLVAVWHKPTAAALAFKDAIDAAATQARDLATKLGESQQAFRDFTERFPAMSGKEASAGVGEIMALFGKAEGAGAQGLTKKAAPLLEKMISGQKLTTSEQNQFSKLYDEALKGSDIAEARAGVLGHGGVLTGIKKKYKNEILDEGSGSKVAKTLFSYGGTQGRVMDWLAGGDLGDAGRFGGGDVGGKRLEAFLGDPANVVKLMGITAGQGTAMNEQQIEGWLMHQQKTFTKDKVDAAEKLPLSEIRRIQGKTALPDSLLGLVAGARDRAQDLEYQNFELANRKAKLGQSAPREFNKILRDAMLEQMGGEESLRLQLAVRGKAAQKGPALVPDFKSLTRYGMDLQAGAIRGGVGTAGQLTRDKIISAGIFERSQVGRKGRLTRGRAALGEQGFSDLQYKEDIGEAEDARTKAYNDAESDRTAAYKSMILDIDKGIKDAALGDTVFPELEADEFEKALREMRVELTDLAGKPKALDKALLDLESTARENSTTQGILGKRLEILRTVREKSIKLGATEADKRKTANEAFEKSALLAELENFERTKNIESLRKFYTDNYLDNLKKERGILAGRIAMEERMVKEGKLSVDALNQNKEKFEDLSRTLGLTNDVLGVTLGNLRAAYRAPLSGADKTAAQTAAGRGLYKPLTDRKRTAAGARDLLGQGDPQQLFREGVIGAAEYKRILQESRADRTTASPMAAFREEFLYGGRDHMLEFESGVVNVANTMKSSFADAFKSISSGAATGKEAIVAFADGILNSISDVSANMATNMMFSRLFPTKSEGGYIPRFQGGGVVTGGSGVRDDVPAMMSGGEYVIRKSAAQKIGYGTLDAINYQGGGQTAQPQYSGMDIAKMYGISAAAGLASGQLNQPDERAKAVFQNYGQGRSELGYLGGADPDAGGRDRITGGRSSAQVSLGKAFVYYRRDPVTGALVSERARPTEGKFETSSLLSTMGLLREDDPQTARMFSKEQKLASYQDYLTTEKKRRKDVLKAHDKMLRGRIIGAYVNAAMLVGGSYLMSGGTGGVGTSVDQNPTNNPSLLNTDARGGSVPRFGGGGSSGAGRVSPALLMGGEYVMSPDAVRTHGVNFMSELNRGNVPGGAGGGFFTGGGASLGGGAMAGLTTNNVKININVDKSGKAEVGSTVNQGLPVSQDERDTNNEVENNKAMGKLLQGVVLQEIVRQQRPGGLLVRP